MKKTCSNQLNLSPISSFKALDELYRLNCVKAVGNDGLPISYLVKAADFIYQPLTHIFNTSIASSIFPDEMKIAKVIPLFKNGDRCRQHQIIDQYHFFPHCPKLLKKLYVKCYLLI